MVLYPQLEGSERGEEGSRQLSRDAYTVGWICALPVELAAAATMLDEEHQNLEQDINDPNAYTLGSIGDHNIVITCLPGGLTGTASAAATAMRMASSFPSIRICLLVGIGGGVPSKEEDIRLGDVVVSTPSQVNGGVVQFDFGKTTPKGFIRTGFQNAPPTVLLNTLAKLRAKHIRGKSRLAEHLSRFDNLPAFSRKNAGPDLLFKADYNHAGGTTCRNCCKANLVSRKRREQEVAVHYGTIASGNQVMRDGIERDRVSSELGGVLCFEMEAAGLMNTFPCVVIRGISDYADSHKNKKWQLRAAASAAAYAKEVLLEMPPVEVPVPRTLFPSRSRFVFKNSPLVLPQNRFRSPDSNQSGSVRRVLMLGLSILGKHRWRWR